MPVGASRGPLEVLWKSPEVHCMRRRGVVTLALPLVWLVAATPGAQAPHVTRGERPSTSWLDQYRGPASGLILEAVGSTFASQRLAVLTDSLGHRLGGTP